MIKFGLRSRGILESLYGIPTQISTNCSNVTAHTFFERRFQRNISFIFVCRDKLDARPTPEIKSSVAKVKTVFNRNKSFSPGNWT